MAEVGNVYPVYVRTRIRDVGDKKVFDVSMVMFAGYRWKDLFVMKHGLPGELASLEVIKN